MCHYLIIYTNILIGLEEFMKKLQINPQHRALIESVIRESSKFKGHEELIEIFCEAIYKKSYLLIDAIRDMSRLRRHLQMICDSCMEQIIKEKKMYDETRLYKEIELKTKLDNEVVSLKAQTTLKEDTLEEKIALKKAENQIVNLKEEIQRSEKYNAVDNLIDPLEFCPQKRVSENTIEKLIRLVKLIDDQYPKKQYYKIFSLRYMKRYDQNEIARQLKIPQTELSKRFVELIKYAKNYTN